MSSETFQICTLTIVDSFVLFKIKTHFEDNYYFKILKIYNGKKVTLVDVVYVVYVVYVV